MVFYITDGKAVSLFYATQLPCRSWVIILSRSSYHRSDVIYVRQLPSCMPGCLSVGAILISLNFRGCNNGKPSKIITDHGTQLTSPIWSEFSKVKDIQPVFSAIRHLQSNTVERIHKELSRFFRSLTGEKRGSW